MLRPRRWLFCTRKQKSFKSIILGYFLIRMACQLNLTRKRVRQIFLKRNSSTLRRAQMRVAELFNSKNNSKWVTIQIKLCLSMQGRKKQYHRRRKLSNRSHANSCNNNKKTNQNLNHNKISNHRNHNNSNKTLNKSFTNSKSTSKAPNQNAKDKPRKSHTILLNKKIKILPYTILLSTISSSHWPNWLKLSK